MKRTLTAPVQLWQLVLVSVMVAVLTSTAVVSAAPYAPSFLAAGTTRYAVASCNTCEVVDTGAPREWVLKTSFTVPAGMVADLMAIGSADLQGGAAGYHYCYGQYRLDGTAGAGNSHTGGTGFSPGNYILYGFNPSPNNLTVPINGFLKNVAAGAHVVYQVMEAGYNDCIVNYDSMIVIANLH